MRPVPCVAAVCFAVVATAALAGEELTPVEYYSLLEQAEAHSSAGEHAGAAALYERLLASNPAEGSLRRRLALSLYRSGESERALELGIEATRMGYGRLSNNAMMIARGMASAGRTEEALAWIEEALAARYERRGSLQTDEAFEGMRSDPRFRELAGYPPEEEWTREQGWRHDLDFFLAEARRLHAAPSGVASSGDFAAAVRDVQKRVPVLSDDEIGIELMRLAVRLGDGHTSLRARSTDRVRFDRLPVRFYFFADGIHIIDATDEHRDLVGKRVLAIGDRDVTRLAQVLEDLKPYVSRDNDQGVLANGPWRLRTLGVLEAMGYTDAADRAVLTVEEGDGLQRTVELVAKPAGGGFSWLLAAPEGTASTDVPLWLQDTGNMYWHRRLPRIDALYLQFNQVGDKDGESLDDYAREVVSSLRKKPARNLILDLRHNGGGNNFRIWPMVRTVVFHEMADPSNRVFVITGRKTFSACQDLVNFLDRMTGAVFVGEPSGSRPNFTGETSQVTLPYSGLRFSISSRYWQDSWPEDMRPWVPVSMPVPYRSTDYFGNVDPVMAALELVLRPARRSAAAGTLP